MLVDLEELDVDPGHDVSHGSEYYHSSRPSLGCKVASKGMSSDDDCSSVADKGKDDYSIPIHAVEEDDLVSNDGYELKDDKQRSWQYGVQVELHTFLIVSIGFESMAKDDFDSPILKGTCNQ